MNDEDARKIATQAIDTWPRGPKAYIWRNELAHLDAGIARAAMRELRQLRQYPTTADFHSAYRTQLRCHAADESTLPPSCGLCDGTGWVDAPERSWPAHDNQPARTTTQAQPCRCSIGRDRERSRIWLERNRIRPAPQQETTTTPELFP